MLRVEFGAATEGATWTMQAGTGGCTGTHCQTMVVSQGAITWPIGAWMRLKLAARRLGTGKTRLNWSIEPVGSIAGVHLPVNSSVDVDTLAEARGSVAIGSGFDCPVSQWDNLTVSPL